MCLCVLALPLDLGVSDFCSFTGGHSEGIRQMRFLRQQGAHSACLVILNFHNQAGADEFSLNFNSKPVGPWMHTLLADELLC